jgi:hypothetical protein
MRALPRLDGPVREIRHGADGGLLFGGLLFMIAAKFRPRGAGSAVAGPSAAVPKTDFAEDRF